MASPIRLLNEALNIDFTLVELKQRHIENFSEAMLSWKDLSIPKYRGEVVRTAVQSGWFASPAISPEDVGNMKASEIRWMADKLVEAFTAAMEIDPK